MNKKGMELSLTTIIVAIIVIVVLVSVVVFFLGSFKGVTDAIKGVFFGTTAGTDRSLAIQICGQRCDQLDLMPTSLWLKSAFCESTFNIDEDGDGTAEKTSDGEKYLKYYCYNEALKTDEESLNVECMVEGKKFKCTEATLPPSPTEKT